MKNLDTKRPCKPALLFTVVMSLASAGVLLAAAVDAQARERNATVTGPGGNVAQRHATRSQGDVSSTTTGPNGRTASRNVDRSPGAATATVTGPSGQTATRNTTRTDGGSQTTVTGPNGQTNSLTVTRQP